MINNDYSVADLAAASQANLAKKTELVEPKPADVGDFQKAMSHGDKTIGEADHTHDVDDKKSGGDNKLDGDQMKKLLMMLMEMITMLMKSLEGGDKDKGENDNIKGGDSKGGAEHAGGADKGEKSDKSDNAKGADKEDSDSAKVENGKVVSENKVGAGDDEIPKPTEHMQSFDLGGKTVNIGGDGTASATEVKETKETLQNLYENSTTFKEMIDSSPNDNFEVSVGKRDDNLSWGNADGRIFMNVNNITPGANDSFEALTAHEMGHAGIGMQHGAEMDKFAQTVAAEA